MLALITGASSGMGLEYATQLAAKGYDLLLVSNQQKELEDVSASLCGRFGVKVMYRFQDLATDSAADELFRYCNEEGLAIDILVNNAGMFFFGEINGERLAKADAMMHLHMVTPTRLCVLFGGQMKERRSGCILNMSSMAAKLPAPGIAIYSATKAYLKSFGESLFYEMRPYGIHVTTVMPAAIATPLYRLRQELMDLGVKTGIIKTPQWLVKKAIKGMEKGRKFVRPGFMNIYLPLLLKALPNGLEGRIWARFRQ